jgi:3-oxoacyl-[acyl-carrier protein] reductase
VCPDAERATVSATGRRRVALLSDANGYVGPHLARVLATRGHDLVLGDPAPGLVEELSERGARVEAVDGVRDLRDPASNARLVAAALDRMGRIDAAVAFTGRIVVGRFLRSTLDDLRAALAGCVEAPYHFLRAVVPVMVDQGDGQVLVFTSAAGARPTPGAPLNRPPEQRRTCWSATWPTRWWPTTCRSTPSARTSWPSPRS